ncbi:hypothetical protein CPB86DRAFT_820686 [Serendipita vermifera]|nr:hypothetical protein CPB86DRAFT_820686 [Serendipita vermifera]
MSTLPTAPFVSSPAASPAPDLPETPRELQAHSPVRGSYMAEEKLLLSPLPLSAGSEGFNRPNMLTRKYSGVWRKSWWNHAVVVGLIPRIVYGSVALACVILWIGITVYFTHEDTSWATKQVQGSKPVNATTITTTTITMIVIILAVRVQTYVALEGLIKNFDTVSRTLNVQWSGLWRDPGNRNMSFVQLGNGTYPNLPWPIEIYRDTATTLWIWGEKNDAEYPTNLYYKISNSSTPAIAVIGTTPDDSFDTQISFTHFSETDDIRKQPLLAYPFDEWKGSIAFSTNDPWSDQSF